MCAHAVSVSLGKIDGIESVKLSLKDGTARIVLKRGNDVTLEHVREVVRKNGFTPREAVVTAEGEVSADADHPVLTITGTKETLRVTEAPGTSAALGPHLGQRVLVTGTVPVPVQDQPPKIEIRRIERADAGGR